MTLDSVMADTKRVGVLHLFHSKLDGYAADVVIIDDLHLFVVPILFPKL